MRIGEREWTVGGGMGGAFEAARNGLPLRSWVILAMGIVWIGLGINDRSLVLVIVGAVIMALAVYWIAGSIRSGLAAGRLKRGVVADEQAEKS